MHPIAVRSGQQVTRDEMPFFSNGAEALTRNCAVVAGNEGRAEAMSEAAHRSTNGGSRPEPHTRTVM